MTRLDEITQRIEEIDAQIEALGAERKVLRDESLLLRSPWAPGTLIEWEFGKGTRRGRIVSIHPSWGTHLEFQCRLIKKDGTEGTMCAVREYSNPRKIEG